MCCFVLQRSKQAAQLNAHHLCACKMVPTVQTGKLTLRSKWTASVGTLNWEGHSDAIRAGRPEECVLADGVATTATYDLNSKHKTLKVEALKRFSKGRALEPIVMWRERDNEVLLELTGKVDATKKITVRWGDMRRPAVTRGRAAGSGTNKCRATFSCSASGMAASGHPRPGLLRCADASGAGKCQAASRQSERRA